MRGIAVILLAASILPAQGEQHMREDGWVPEVLVIDLDGNGIDLQGVASGVRLEFGDKVLRRSGWTRPKSDDSFIVVDMFQSGEFGLLGRRFGPPNGFQYLKGTEGQSIEAKRELMKQGGGRIIRNPDGKMDKRDAAFETLILWTDANADGRVEDLELQSLAWAGFESIDLTLTRLELTGKSLDAHGNRMIERAKALRLVNGQQKEVDVFSVRLAAAPVTSAR